MEQTTVKPRTPKNGDLEIPPGLPQQPAAAADLTKDQLAMIMSALADMKEQHPAAQPPAQQPQFDASLVAAIANAVREQVKPSNEQLFNQELQSLQAKTVLEDHKAALVSARQRAARSNPLMDIATDSNQISVHIDGWQLVKKGARVHVVGKLAESHVK
jgi:hypothetical protein